MSISCNHQTCKNKTKQPPDADGHHYCLHHGTSDHAKQWQKRWSEKSKKTKAIDDAKRKKLNQLRRSGVKMDMKERDGDKGSLPFKHLEHHLTGENIPETISMIASVDGKTSEMAPNLMEGLNLRSVSDRLEVCNRVAFQTAAGIMTRAEGEIILKAVSVATKQPVDTNDDRVSISFMPINNRSEFAMLQAGEFGITSIGDSDS